MAQCIVLGSTGSVGEATLSVIEANSTNQTVFALVACTSWRRLLQQCLRHNPTYALLTDVSSEKCLREALSVTDCKTKVLPKSDLQALLLSPSAEVVISAIVGAAGFLPTFWSVCSGKRVLLANKESLVMAGSLIMEAAQTHGAVLLPLDSEHSGILQCFPKDFLPGQPLPQNIDSVLLTASGGPFRNRNIKHFKTITPEEACAHPNWRMGKKISVDSATMMNKVFELIESRWLFNLLPSQMEVLLHPQSLVHALVRYQDASILAQIGPTDMRVPIAKALNWPEDSVSGVARVDWSRLLNLDFLELEVERFPCFSLIKGIWEHEASSAVGVTINAANEIAVEAFLVGRIRFDQIYRVISEVVECCLPSAPLITPEAILQWDTEVRVHTERYIQRFS